MFPNCKDKTAHGKNMICQALPWRPAARSPILDLYSQNNAGLNFISSSHTSNAHIDAINSGVKEGWDWKRPLAEAWQGHSYLLPVDGGSKNPSWHWKWSSGLVLPPQPCTVQERRGFAQSKGWDISLSPYGSFSCLPDFISEHVCRCSSVLEGPGWGVLLPEHSPQTPGAGLRLFRVTGTSLQCQCWQHWEQWAWWNNWFCFPADGHS